jgi:hypothetical protein
MAETTTRTVDSQRPKTNNFRALACKKAINLNGELATVGRVKFFADFISPKQSEKLQSSQRAETSTTIKVKPLQFNFVEIND